MDGTSAQVVLITGASSGIGRACAERMAGPGTVLVLCSRSAQALEVVAARCRERGATVDVAVLDVTDHARVEEVVTAAVAAHGHLDVCISSAAVMAYGTHVQTPTAVFDRVVAVNLLGAAALARSVLIVFRAQRHGTLVVIGSLLGRVPVPLAGSYVVSKWGLRGLTRSLRQEQRDLPDVHVTSVAPGAITTPIYRQAATYLGRVGSPPPPTTTPERVARVVAKAVARPRRERDADVLGGLLNKVMRLGFLVVPSLYDVLVGPLMRRLGVAQQPSPDGPGNVFDPHPELER